MSIPPLLHTHLQSPSEVRDSPYQAAHYRLLSPEIRGFISLTRHLARYWQEDIPEFLYLCLYHIWIVPKLYSSESRNIWKDGENAVPFIRPMLSYSVKPLSCVTWIKRKCVLIRKDISLTHGAEPFLRSRQFCSFSRTSRHFMEPEGSLPCSQDPSTGRYPEPDQSNSWLYNGIKSFLFASCLTTLSVSKLNGFEWWQMKQKDLWRIWSQIVEHLSKDWRKTAKTLIRIVGVKSKIGNEDLQKTSPERYRRTNLSVILLQLVRQSQTSYNSKA
jgi:hypothetical protein